MADADEKKGVRFAQQGDQAGQDGELRLVQTFTNQATSRADFNEETEQELQRLKTQLRNNIQSQRMQHHNFEPVSLPGSTAVSRVSCQDSPMLQQTNILLRYHLLLAHSLDEHYLLDQLEALEKLHLADRLSRQLYTPHR